MYIRLWSLQSSTRKTNQVNETGIPEEESKENLPVTTTTAAAAKISL